MSKGDTYRPVDKRQYDRNYMRLYGKECPLCFGSGYWPRNSRDLCFICAGLGFVEKKHATP